MRPTLVPHGCGREFAPSGVHLPAMTVRFRSKAGGDILMLDAHAHALHRLIGRAPSGQGILEPKDMAQALQALDAAFAADEAARAATGEDDTAVDVDSPAADAARDPLPLKRRLWPMRELVRRSLADQVPIVWGV